eukprot:CAMPEP_0171997376 /NCGR_PEP_ID=MMETSP1041-20130122/650_1 /TAXON_ID=464988 /ORGANISM="Hemiselmis andersenii, Strain CCMP439" /LENGTH=199 /DNA_ID=CAMNT_0012650639 /DNA_START=605 /DNA_END=1201 /DNA_ORIENTATION=+
MHGIDRTLLPHGLLSEPWVTQQLELLVAPPSDMVVVACRKLSDPALVQAPFTLAFLRQEQQSKPLVQLGRLPICRMDKLRHRAWLLVADNKARGEGEVDQGGVGWDGPVRPDAPQPVLERVRVCKRWIETDGIRLGPLDERSLWVEGQREGACRGEEEEKEEEGMSKGGGRPPHQEGESERWGGYIREQRRPARVSGLE